MNQQGQRQRARTRGCCSLAEALALMRPELSAGGERSLRNFLGELVWRHFFEDVRLEEPRVTTYVASLLADFARTENLYRIRSEERRVGKDVWWWRLLDLIM